VSKNKTMLVTWMGHSCISVERDGFTLVVDPGALSVPTAAVGADALLITHEHLDHYDITKIAPAIAARPGLPIYTNASVAALLEQSGAGTGAKIHVIGDGAAFEAGGFDVHCHGELHAPIHPDVERVRNTGFLIDGRLFHPGDAFTEPGVPIDLLLLPLHGFYTKAGPEVDYVRQLKPARVAPVHDGTLNPIGQAGVDAFYARHPSPPQIPGTGSPYQRVPVGQSIEL
jgi:L-ascorbate metabolism protein UlaG (beta-lactamase superfamily)